VCQQVADALLGTAPLRHLAHQGFVDGPQLGRALVDPLLQVAARALEPAHQPQVAPVRPRGLAQRSVQVERHDADAGEVDRRDRRHHQGQAVAARDQGQDIGQQGRKHKAQEGRRMGGEGGDRPGRHAGQHERHQHLGDAVLAGAEGGPEQAPGKPRRE
jgi:hypothetical protein